MKKTFIKKLEEVLKTRRSDILNKNDKDLDIDFHGDDTDRIQGKIIANITAQLNFRERERLELIDRALLRIKNGTFGQCEECEEPISDKRLELNPEFNKCIGCVEESEREAKNNRLRGIV